MNEYFEHVGVWRCKVRIEQVKDQQIAIRLRLNNVMQLL